ncbi:MAG: serine/threonine-protein kinase [Phycisphaerales bacterium]
MRDESPKAPHGSSDRAAKAPSEFLARPFLGADFHVDRAMADAALPIEPPMPERAHSFVVGQLIGSGTFASVYAATQDRPVARRVALKVLRASVDQRSTRQRFLREQQSLARLEHPGIARLYESGMTSDGRLYFAMEFVEGETIDRAATRHGLSVAERVRLVRDACRAVHHAHMKGLIHRDLKPGNIMVATAGGELAVKVIDFGIAKAIDAPIDDSSLKTVAGQLVGTPAYMAPEQLEGRVDDVDVRSDVYALGAVLYELLSGRRPHETCGMAPGDAARLIRANRLPALRGSVVGVSGDLDRAVACALSPEPGDRYQSAGEFAADLDRILRGEPILARAPGAWESAWRWSRRNPIPTAVAIAVIAALVTTATVSWTFARSAQKELRSAEREIELSLTMIEEFLKAAAQLADRSGVVAERRAFLEKAVDMSAQLLALHPERSKLQRARADALTELSKILRDATPNDLAGARRLRAEAIAIRESLVANDGNADDRAAYAIALILCGDIEKERGHWDDAQRRYEQALEEHQRLSREHPDDLDSARQAIFGLERLGHLAELRKQWEQSGNFYRRQFAAIESLCAAHPDRVDLLWDRCLARGHLIAPKFEEQDLDTALRLAGASCADAARLLASDRDSHSYRELEAGTRVMKCRVLRGRGEMEQARDLISDACRVFEELAAADPGQIDAQIRMSGAFIEKACILAECGEVDAAWQISERVNGLWESLLRDRPDDAVIKLGVKSAKELREQLVAMSISSGEIVVPAEPNLDSVVGAAKR